MKYLAIYWMVGCILFGLSAGLRKNNCPDESWADTHTMAFAVSVWPAVVLAVAVGGKSGPFPCEVKTQVKPIP
jgi:hypothetical protein